EAIAAAERAIAAYAKAVPARICLLNSLAHVEASVDSVIAVARAVLEVAPANPIALEDLAQALDGCRECPLGALATQGVPGEGPRSGARLMFVGEQPGDQEDLRGRPFVGPAGQLLDRAFKDLGWPRDKVYVTNAVKHFKWVERGKRRIHQKPSAGEVDACRHWLDREVELVRPDVLVALGATALRPLFEGRATVSALRGEVRTSRYGLPAVVTVHPSAIVRIREAGERQEAFAGLVDDLRLAAKAAA
ncbi:MAG TPA: UdgX family uracil-DNA binding protein, partial [Acidimicrobiales bacterium]